MLAPGRSVKILLLHLLKLSPQGLKIPSLLPQGHSLLGNRVTVLLASQVFTSYFTDWSVKGEKKSFHP